MSCWPKPCRPKLPSKGCIQRVQPAEHPTSNDATPADIELLETQLTSATTSSAEKPPARSATTSASRAERRAAPATRALALTDTHMPASAGGQQLHASATSPTCQLQEPVVVCRWELPQRSMHARRQLLRMHGQCFTSSLACRLVSLPAGCAGAHKIHTCVSSHRGACSPQEEGCRCEQGQRDSIGACRLWRTWRKARKDVQR